MKFATKPIRHYPPHLKHVAALPWEIKNLNFCRYSADVEENANKLHFECTRWIPVGEVIRTVQCCIVYDIGAERYAHTYEQFLKASVVGLIFVYLFRFCTLCVFLWFSLDYFVFVLFAVVVLGLVSSVPRHEIGWEERLWNDLFCAEWEWDMKALTHITNIALDLTAVWEAFIIC